jgi:lipoprotein NlpD
MTEKTSKLYLLGTVLASFALAGCASSAGPAPVVDLNASSSRAAATASPPANAPASTAKYVAPVTQLAASHGKDWRPQTYVVQKGDTLYSIAFNFGFDYHDLAQLNGIQDPTMIHVGEELRLFPANGAAATHPAQTVAPAVVATVDQPKVVKLPYSEQAVAQIEQMQQQQAAAPKSAPAPKPVVAQAIVANVPNNGPVSWGVPASGKLLDGFSEKDGRKGVDIAGKLGQPVFASAPGKVVYSGTGLRGYGKLVIIKHNATYLSAYAHNSRIVVKEGQNVARGQKIAEMGDTDAKRVELHFEIRKLGKPVDPAQYIRFPNS